MPRKPPPDWGYQPDEMVSTMAGDDRHANEMRKRL